MSLQELPNEIFRPIIDRLVKEDGAVNAANYRLVNKAFAVNIAESIIDRVSKIQISIIRTHDAFSRLFEAQTSAILQRKLVHPRLEKHCIFVFTKDLVDKVMKIKGQVSEPIRAQYIASLCDIVGAVRPKVLTEYMIGTGKQDLLLKDFSIQEMLPAIGSAIGDVGILSKSIKTPRDIFKQANGIFPNALEAAIASAQTDVLKGHLKYISKNVKGKPDTNDWKQMRIATKYLGKDLSVAVRLHKDEAGAIIFDFLDTNKSFRRSCSLFLGKNLFNDAVRYGNRTLIYRAIELDREPRRFYEQYHLENSFKLDTYKMEFLLKSGSESILTMLLQNGNIALNQSIETMTPLAFSLENHRRDLAEVLLANGANVDAVLSIGDKKTALWNMASNGHIDDLMFLLRHGAKPANPEDRKNCPLQVAKKGWWNKCVFLLEKASREGKDSVFRPDIWFLYEEYMEAEHKRWY